MLPEEAMRGSTPRMPIALSQQSGDPGGVCRTVLIAVAVRKVIHHLAVMYTSLVVYLPEDNASQLRCPHAITAGCTEHLFPREIAGMHDRLTELVVDRQALPPHESRRMRVKRHGTNLLESSLY